MKYCWEAGACQLVRNNAARDGSCDADPRQGEMWDLERLSAACVKHKRWSFFLTSMPLNIPGGVAGPANVIAIL